MTNYIKGAFNDTKLAYKLPENCLLASSSAGFLFAILTAERIRIQAVLRDRKPGPRQKSRVFLYEKNTGG